jgi:hypothetical protein
MNLNESTVENVAVTWIGELGYAIGHGPQIAPGQPAALMYKAVLWQNTEFLFLPALCALRVSVFPFPRQPKLPSRVSCMESLETMIEEVS